MDVKYADGFGTPEHPGRQAQEDAWLTSRGFNVEVVIGPPDASGQVRMECRRNVAIGDVAAYTALLATRGYGSPYHDRTGEFVAGVQVALRADHRLSPAEGHAVWALGTGHVRYSVHGDASDVSPEALLRDVR